MNKKWWVIGIVILGCLLLGCSTLDSLKPDPCGWKGREAPLITGIQDGKRVELAPNIGVKKIIFTSENGNLNNVRIEIAAEEFISYLDDQTKKGSLGDEELDTKIKEYIRNHSKLEVNTVFEDMLKFTRVNIWEWLYTMVEQGKVAIYDSKTGQCVPYIEVKKWGYSCGKCGGGREFYLPNGVLFLRTTDMVS